MRVYFLLLLSLAKLCPSSSADQVAREHSGGERRVDLNSVNEAIVGTVIQSFMHSVSCIVLTDPISSRPFANRFYVRQ